MGKYDRMFEITDRLLELLDEGRESLSFDEAMELAVGVAGAPHEVAVRSVRAQFAGDPLLAERDGRIVRRSAERIEALLGAPEFVVLDLETTGLGVPNRITEIGAMRVRDGRRGETFQTLVNPCETISERVIALTGITNEMVKDAPTIDEALPKLLAFAGDAVLVAHNMPFDSSFLNHERLRLEGRELHQELLCTVRLARRILPDQKEFHLDDLAARFGVPIVDRHRSLGDVTVTAAVLLELLARRGDLARRGAS